MGALGWLLVALLVATCVIVWRQSVQAERLRKALGIALTHHMRTSLAHIQTYNEMLLLETDESADQRREWLEVVGREAQHLGTSVENLLFLIQERSARSFPIRRAVDLGTVLEDVASAHGGSGVDLRVEPPAGVMVEADPAAIQQAVGNLIDAAVRAAAPGSKVWATVASDGARARVLVLFEALCAGATANARWSSFDCQRLEGETSAGFGLELAVVRHIAKLHGGRAGFIQLGDQTGYQIELPVAGA